MLYLLSENPILSPFVDAQWAFSYITEMELLSKKAITDYEDALIREMLDDCLKIMHSQVLSDIVIKLRRNNNIKLPDAIIAATAQLMRMPLITADKGFAKIKEIDSIILDF